MSPGCSGPNIGAIVLALDCLKGATPTALLPLLLLAPDAPQRLHLEVLSGVAAILGHMFPCWIGFRGGKGVATALGVAVVLAPAASGVALVVFAVCFAATRIVSLSSIIGACAFCALELWRLRPAPFAEPTWSLAAFSTVVPILIIVRHRANLARLVRGTEPRFKFGEKAGGTTREVNRKRESRQGRLSRLVPIARALDFTAAASTSFNRDGVGQAGELGGQIERRMRGQLLHIIGRRPT